MTNLASTLVLFSSLVLTSWGLEYPPNSLDDQMTYQTENLVLPPPDMNHNSEVQSTVIGWGEKTPAAPEGFEVLKFAEGLNNPRNTYQLPNGYILVAEANKPELSANRITLLIDTNGDGIVEESNVFLSGITQPYGMAYANGKFYVGATDAIWVYDYNLGDKQVTAAGKKIMELPVGGHWTRNILLSPDQKSLYVAVGSASNVAETGLEAEHRRANILKINIDGSGEEVFASGLRNPVGMDYSSSGKLWTVVNERDKLGDYLVPDYLAEVEAGEFYGWPFAYFGPNEDPRLPGARPDLLEQTELPEVALGSHTASLGLAFYNQTLFPEKYRWGAFIGQHGSWNSSQIVGYQVVFVPFKEGQPSGDPEVFLSGFISNLETSEVHGRPVGITVLQNGALLIADDASNILWMVRPASAQQLGD